MKLFSNKNVFQILIYADVMKQWQNFWNKKGGNGKGDKVTKLNRLTS